MELIFILSALFIETFLLMKIINFSIVYIFVFKRKPLLWIFFMFFISFLFFAIGGVFDLKFYLFFWPILLVSIFQFVKPESNVNLIDNILLSKNTFNEIDEKNGWFKKVAGNFMFLVGAVLGYYLFCSK